jgi:hypothetical protein
MICGREKIMNKIRDFKYYSLSQIIGYHFGTLKDAIRYTYPDVEIAEDDTHYFKVVIPNGTYDKDIYEYHVVNLENKTEDVYTLGSPQSSIGLCRRTQPISKRQLTKSIN